MDLRAEPWRYPGTAVTVSGVLGQTAGETFAELVPDDSGPAAADTSSLLAALDTALVSRGATGLDRRTAVVGTGSNTDPQVLAAKLRRAGVDTVVPMLVGSADRLGVGHSGHVSRAGYIAATPYLAVDGHPIAPDQQGDGAPAASAVVVALLEDGQLAAVDATEPNYLRVAAPGPVRVDGQALPMEAQLYVSKWGVLAGPECPAVPLGTQAEVFARAVTGLDAVARLLDLPATPLSEPQLRALMARLAGDAALRERVREVWRHEGWCRATGLT